REIRMRADDSVLMLRGNRPYMVRRSRGYAPLPVTCPVRVKKPLLAVGGELKNAFCLVTEDQYYLSPHIGDLGDPRAVETLGGTIDRMSKLLGLKPEAVACDLHPGYRSVEYARQTGLPLVPVQHHFAHVVSCMAENGIQDGESVIGAAFDGTGYGTDGTIWGGEFLKASYSEFERMGSIRPFALAGGDRAAREGYRPAVSLLLQAYNGDAEKVGRIVSRLSLCEEPQLSAQIGMIRNRFNSVMTTSVGRLFDAVAAILGVKRFSTFEGEAASALEYASAESADGFRFRPVVEQEKLFVLQTGDVIQYITESILEEKSPALLARQFHEAAAAMVAAGCVECRNRTGINTVALSGGVFQNLLLLRLCENMLGEQGFRVLTHSMVPANDGGIALGQAVAAAAGFGR
ncbi:MAG TPA: carbamoyltransferase HypF, partial [Clostridia bacterium]|nr:carbamoyltransferase HypF [Clostridia bacterium]